MRINVNDGIFFSAGGFNGYYGSTIQHCHFNPNHLSDVEFIISYWFNKAEYLRFNSTVGKFVGYTEHGVHNAENFNKDKGILAQWQAQRDRYCKPNVQIDMNAILTKKGEHG